MSGIPFAQIGVALDGQEVVLVHHAPLPKYPGAATPVGNFVRMASCEWDKECREAILGTLDGFPSRVFDGTSEYKRLGTKGQKSFHRAHRFVDVQLGGAMSDESTVEFAANHLRSGGSLEGCDPGDRVLVRRDEPNEAFLKAFDLACSRCRGYK